MSDKDMSQFENEIHESGAAAGEELVKLGYAILSDDVKDKENNELLRAEADKIVDEIMSDDNLKSLFIASIPEGIVREWRNNLILEEQSN